MNGNAIDTLRLANRLKDAGFDARGAEGMARALCDELEGRVVTKSYLEMAADRTETRLGAAIAGVDAKVETLHHALDDNVAALNAKFASLDGKVSALDTRVSSLEGKVSALDGKVSVLDGKVSVLDGKVSALDGKVSALDAKMELTAASLEERMEHNNRWMIFVASLLFTVTLAGGAPQYFRMLGVGQPPAMSTPATSVVQEGTTRPAGAPPKDSETEPQAAAADLP